MTLKKIRNQNIDTLRGFSILIVVLFHFTFHYSSEYLFFIGKEKINLFKFGWIGVDLFFLISGYCIALTISKSKNFYDFITKRFSRLYPAYFVCGLITLFFYFFFDLPGREVDMFTGLMNLLLFNIVPGFNFKYIDGIYWALVVEAKFYIIFGLFYFFGKQNIKTLYCFSLFCFLGSIYFINYSQNFSFISSIFPHINIFLFGICLFNLKKINKIFFYLLIIYLIFIIFLDDRYNEVQILLSLLLFLFSIFLISKKEIKFNILSRIGFISYSWYLIHNAVGIIIIRELNKQNFEDISVFISILITLILSKIVNIYIELHFKNLFNQFFRNLYKKLKLY